MLICVVLYVNMIDFMVLYYILYLDYNTVHSN